MKKETDTTLIFDSARCYVRPFAERDLDDFTAYRNNAEWMKFQHFKGLARAEYQAILLKEQSVESGAQFAIVSKSTEKLIGDVFIKKEDEVFWIGYTVSPSFKRQGFASEVTSALIRWIRQQGAYVIKAGADPENTASIQMLKKLQFTKVDEEEGEFIYALPPDVFIEEKA